ncbi:OmpA family protein [Algoriphagus taiwanensis]
MMKRYVFFLLLFIGMGFLSDFGLRAQFIKDLKKRAEEAAKRTVERKTEEKTEQTTEQAIDSLFSIRVKKKNPESNPEEVWEENADPVFPEDMEESFDDPGPKSLQAYSKFDFILGSDILYASDFSGDALGDMPEGWVSSIVLELVEINGFEGKWIQLGKGENSFTPIDLGELPENFTLEFDLILDVDAQKFAPGTRQFLVVLNDLESPTIQLGNRRAGNHLVNMGFNADHKNLEKRWKDSQYNEFVNTPIPMLSKENLERGDVIRVSLWKNKNRVRLYLDEEKVFDIVQAQPDHSPFRSLKFYSNNANEDEFFYFSNLRFADAPPIIKNKLAEGVFEATGIYFDPGSAVIRPESYPTLKQIADFIQANGGSFSIAGHTDTTGDKEQNRLLSEQRASAVRKALVKEFGVDTNQLASRGYGQRYPLYPNDTPEGRAKNRRVDIINLQVVPDYEEQLMVKVFGEGRN